ncbi:hypothetical protein FV218_15135 [Methylobacterium sp. WL69]|uniref:hypothetical protein n=1 Tax=Methylobacterium sp. WL69 TaxID=2603893 RepID=UPI0011CA6A7B|nr:hypothetical protein [Methylobacterium sp. WL69]TXM71465.1 hypothetical protein FV218_15135 [Methylobacterium sp. WL69]
MPDGVDLAACRDIHTLAEAIEGRRTTSAEEAMAAVKSILANYQRAQFADLAEATKNACALLMRRPPGLVAMLSDPEYGIAGHERYPPTLAQFTEAAEKAEKRVLLAACGARRALGLTLSCLGNPRG